MDCSMMTRHIRRLASKKQIAVQWRGQIKLGAITADFDITVGATRERIGLPVVGVAGFQ